tara:strand:+ start:13288 stop:13821 length:534 start_codon:yes stop_codon:yes gene_type:complete
MCEPTTLMAVSMGLSAMQAGSKYMAEKDAAKSQRRSQEEAMEANLKANAEQADIARQDEAKAEEASVRSQKDAEIKSKQDRAKIATAAGEAGVTGNSVNLLLADAQRQMLGFKETKLRETQLNAQATTNRLNTSLSNVKATNRNINKPVRGPSGMGALLSGATDIASTYRGFKSPTS